MKRFLLVFALIVGGAILFVLIRETLFPEPEGSVEDPAASGKSLADVVEDAEWRKDVSETLQDN